MTISRITGGPVTTLFTAKVLGKYFVDYARCDQTGFIQTEEPYWLDEAYSSAITALDLGLVTRNIEKATFTQKFIHRVLPTAKRFVDYGGGYGIYVRLMRDANYPFRIFDEHCENLFAKGFETPSLANSENESFDLLTAWEVFEHLPNPTAVIGEMCRVANAVLFSTILVPEIPIRSEADWWYFTPETGQHVSFYTRQSLEYLAKSMSVHFYTDGSSNHLFTRKSLRTNPFRESVFKSVSKKIVAFYQSRLAPTQGIQSLRQQDYEQALQTLRESFHQGESR